MPTKRFLQNSVIIISTLINFLPVVSAITVNCYNGTSTDGGFPGGTLTGCYGCTKTITRWTSGTTTYGVYTWSGYGCTMDNFGGSLVSVYGADMLASSASIYGTCALPASTFAAYKNGPDTLPTASSLTVSGDTTSATMCTPTQTVSSCTSSDSNFYAKCICCTDYCNSPTYRCDISHKKADFLLMLMAGLVLFIGQ